MNAYRETIEERLTHIDHLVVLMGAATPTDATRDAVRHATEHVSRLAVEELQALTADLPREVLGHVGKALAHNAGNGK